MLPKLVHTKQKTQQGFATMLGVIILSAVVGFAMSGLGYASFIASGLTRAEIEGAKALRLAEACLELSLEQLRVDPSYSGTVNSQIGTGTCSSTVTGSVSISTTGISGESSRTLTTTVTDTTPYLLTTAWVEQ